MLPPSPPYELGQLQLSKPFFASGVAELMTAWADISLLLESSLLEC